RGVRLGARLASEGRLVRSAARVVRLLYSEAMSVTGHIPGVPSGRRRLSAWLQEKLFERRIVLITGPLDDDAAAEAAAALMALDAAAAAPIELHPESQDGTLESALPLIDPKEQLRAAARIHGRGQVRGPGLGVRAA